MTTSKDSQRPDGYPARDDLKLYSASVERAIEVGARLFADRGYTATTTRQLADALGVTNATFYHHFASKEDLLRLTCERSLETMLREVEDAIALAPAPNRLSAMIKQHMTTVLNKQELHKTMLTQMDGLGQENRDVIVALRDRYERLVEQTLEGARDQGLIRTDVETRVLTLLLLNLLNWTIFWFRREGDLTPEALADNAESIFMDGVRPR